MPVAKARRLIDVADLDAALAASARDAVNSLFDRRLWDGYLHGTRFLRYRTILASRCFEGELGFLDSLDLRRRSLQDWRRRQHLGRLCVGFDPRRFRKRNRGRRLGSDRCSTGRRRLKALRGRHYRRRNALGHVLAREKILQLDLFRDLGTMGSLLRQWGRRGEMGNRFASLCDLRRFLWRSNVQACEKDD